MQSAMRVVVGLLIIVGVVSPVRAGQSEDAAYKAALAVAQNQALSVGAKIAVDHVYAHYAGSAVINDATQQTAGGAAVGAVGVATGIVDYTKSKNDNQRLFAAADTAASGVTIFFPPAGAIAMICVTAARIVDGILAAQSAAVVLHYRQLQIEYINQYVQIHQKIAAAKNLALQRYSDGYNAALAAYTDAKKKAAEVCKNVDKSQDLQEVDTCLSATSVTVNLILVQANAMEGFLDEVDSSRDIQRTFAQNNIDLSKQRNEVTTLRKTFESKKAELDEAYKNFTLASTEYLFKQAREKNLTTLIESAMNDCNPRLADYTLKMSRAAGLLSSSWGQVAAVNENAGLGIKFGELDIKSLASEADEMQAGECFEINADDIKKSTSDIVQIQGRDFLFGRDQFSEMLKELHAKLGGIQ
jgi:hypothetical protein